MKTLRASKNGLERIQKARKERGLNIDDPQWLLEASNILEPHLKWPTMDDKYATSLPTWKRFYYGRAPINENVFNAFCKVLILKPEEVCNSHNYPIENSRKSQEENCYKTMLSLGSLLRIKGAKGMGKRQLIDRMFGKLRENNNDTQIAIINFYSEFNNNSFRSLNEFSKAFCSCIADNLDLPDNLHNWKDERDFSNSQVNNYLEDYILPRIDRHLILVLEGVDRVFEYPLATNFCNLVRGWHSKAQRNEEWQKTSIVITHSTNIYASLDINVSPLANIGTIVALDDFSVGEIVSLAAMYKLNLNADRINQLMQLVSGNPYFVDRALKVLAEGVITLEVLLDKAATEEGIYRDRLSEIWKIIEQQVLLKKSLRLLIGSDEPQIIHPLQLYKLHSLGLVKRKNNTGIICCELYRQYFNRMFLLEGEN
jgi:AAA-like domain